jgi:SAM-dependent methyltransferase
LKQLLFEDLLKKFSQGNKEARVISQNERIRSAIVDVVSAIVPFDRLEEEHVDFVKNWIASGAELFRGSKPDHPQIHLVSYFIVIDQRSNQFLLVDHKKALLWLPPGGHVEVNEDPKDTVRRESKEELGIEADFLFEEPVFLTVTNTVGNPPPHTDVSLWYVLKGNKDDQLAYDAAEFHQIGWFNRQEIPFERADPHLKRFIDKIIKKLVTLNSYDVSTVEYAKNTEQLHPQEEAQRFLNMLPSCGAKIIDIGCGPGRDVKKFLDHGVDVVGIDFSPNMIEAAKKNAPEGVFHVMDIESLTFPSETFDGAWSSCSLLHIPKKNIPFVLNKIHAVLKPNGILYVSVKQGRSSADEMLVPDSRYEGLEKYWSFFEESELIHLLNHSGFKIIHVMTFNPSKDYETHPIIKVFAQKCPI